MNKNAKGKFIKKDNEIYYLIDDVYKMEDFFLTISSSSDIWTFLWSRGGITAGRENSDKALFPYYTDDKIQDMKYCTGALEIIKTDDIFWRPFDPAKKNKCSIAISRNLSKVVFEEKNETLGLSFELSWLNSEKYGLIKKTLIKTAKDISFTILDGARNIMPAGMGADFQNNNSTLLDAYKCEIHYCHENQQYRKLYVWVISKALQYGRIFVIQLLRGRVVYVYGDMVLCAFQVF